MQGLIIAGALPSFPWRAKRQTCTTRCRLSGKLADLGLSRSVPKVEPKVTGSAIDVHAAFFKNIPTNQNVIGRELVEDGKIPDELNPMVEPN
jgi:hypothetical protein